MNSCIYGVDLSKPMNPIMVRDAMVKCFLNAHSSILDDMKDQYKDTKEFNEIKKLDVKLTIKEFFKKTHADIVFLQEVVGENRQHAASVEHRR